MWVECGVCGSPALRSRPPAREGQTEGASSHCQQFPGTSARPGHKWSAPWLAAGLRKVPLRPPWAGYVHVHVKMDLVYGLVWLLTVLLEGISGQGVYGEWNRDAMVTL